MGWATMRDRAGHAGRAALLLLAVQLRPAMAPARVLSVDCDRAVGLPAAEPPTYRSLTAARDALRAARDGGVGGDASDGRATVVVRGRCEGTEPLELGPRDANTDWVAHDAGGATISGGRALPSSMLAPVTDAAVLALLPATARTVARQLNLSAVGLAREDIGELVPHTFPGGDAQIDFYKLRGSGAAELFWGGRPLHRARHPESDDDQLLVPQNSLMIKAVHREPGSFRELTTVDVGASRLAAWGRELAAGRKLWTHGEWAGFGWADTHKPLVAIDAGNSTITTINSPLSGSGGGLEGRSTPGGWFRVYNALSELDTRGEYVIDEFGGSLLLVLMPPDDDDGEMVLSLSATPVLHAANTHGVRCVGIDFAYSRGWGTVFDDCVDCAIFDSRLTNFGINAVNVSAGRNFLLSNATITGTGQGGVILSGGDRITLEPANHTIIGSHITEFARILQKYTPAVCLCGVGQQLLDTEISNGAHFGMLLTGNDHRIARNHFHNLVYGGADAGAVYSGREWTYRGALIEGNTFENINSYLCQAGGAKNCVGQPPRALHADDGISGWTVVNNLFRNVTQVHNGLSNRDMTMMHNRFEIVLSAGQPKTNLDADHRSAIHLDVFGPPPYPADSDIDVLRGFLARVPYNCTDCAWSKYPHLANILDDEYWLPKYWRLENNSFCDITYHGVAEKLMDGAYDHETFGVERNNRNSTACTNGGG